MKREKGEKIKKLVIVFFLSLQVYVDLYQLQLSEAMHWKAKKKKNLVYEFNVIYNLVQRITYKTK